MATPTKNQINADAILAQDTITDLANAAFILAADIAIEQLAAQGKFRYAPLAPKNVSVKDIADYYNGLGYKVTKPCCPWWTCQPTNLFGECWEAYWSNRQICQCKKPCKIIISWR